MSKKCKDHKPLKETTAEVGNDIGELKRYFEMIWKGEKLTVEPSFYC